MRFPAALPHLRGGAAWAYAGAWLVVLALGVAGTAGIVRQRLTMGAGIAYTFAPLGLDYDDSDGQGPTRIGTVLPDVARAADLRSGDAILVVEGIGTTGGAQTARWRLVQQSLLVAEGAGVRLLIRRGGGAARAVTLRHRQANADALFRGSELTPRAMTWADVAVFLLPPLVMGTGAALLFRRRREPIAAVLSLALLALAGSWGNQAAFWIAQDLPWVGTMLGVIGPVALYLALLTFPNGRFRPRATVLLAISYPLLAICDQWWPWLGWIALAYGLFAIALLVVRYRRESAAERRQWKWAMLGLVGGILFMIVAGVADERYYAVHRDLAAELWSWIVTPLLPAVGGAIVVGGLVLSVLRYRLYQTGAAVSRSLAYGALTLAMVAVFAGTEQLVQAAGERLFGASIGALAGALGAAAAAATIGPLHRRLSDWSEHLLRRDLVHLRRELPLLLLDLAETASPAAVAETLLDHLAQELHAVRAAVVEPAEVLAMRGTDGAALALWRSARQGGRPLLDRRDGDFPLRVPLSGVADRWLLVGTRPDGSLYGRDERQLLAELAAPVSEALRVARLCTAWRGEAARLDALEATLGGSGR